MEHIVQNPVVPYNSSINGGFREGRFVRIQGRINQNAHGFKINLMCGPSVGHDDIALHIDARFSDNVLVRNAKIYSNWGTEERHGSGFPLSRGQGFEIMVLCEPQQYKIAINGQHFTEFSHRVPVDRISHVTIEGDIVVTILQFEGGSYSSGSSVPSAPPQFSSSAGLGAAPYPSGGSSTYGSAPIGFVPPPPLPNYTPPAASAYQAGYPQGPPAPGYGPPASVYDAPAHGYGPPAPGYGPPTQGYGPPAPGYGPPAQGYGPGGHYGEPHGGYPSGGGYPNQSYPHGQGSGSGGGIMGSAQKLLAGVGLAGVANKIPGLGGGSHGHGHGHGNSGGHYGAGYPGGGYGHGGAGGGGSGFPGGAGGILGSAAALGIGGALAGKMLKPKKMKKNKLLKYGLPLAGVGVGGYALHKGMKGFRRGSWSGSSSSSSSEEE